MEKRHTFSIVDLMRLCIKTHICNIERGCHRWFAVLSDIGFSHKASVRIKGRALYF